MHSDMDTHTLVNTQTDAIRMRTYICEDTYVSHIMRQARYKSKSTTHRCTQKKIEPLKGTEAKVFW